MRAARASTIVALATAAVLPGCALAAAAAPFPALAQRGTYRGTLAPPRAAVGISLQVSASGRTVAGIRVASLPIFCSGNGPPGTPHVVFSHARISPVGRFASSGRDVDDSATLPHPIVIARLEVTGVFERGGREHGIITIDYGRGPAQRCGGHAAYSTRR